MEDRKDDAVPAPRRPFTAPAIAWEEDFDVKANLASACDKVGGSGGACDDGPSS